MNQIGQLQIQCSIEGHDYIQLACLNEKCKANRVYCLQCLKNGDHVAHMKDQKLLKELIELFQHIGEESESLISKLNVMVGEINQLFSTLCQGLKNKYQFSKERLLRLNANQLNQALDSVIKYHENKTNLLEEVNKCSNDIIIQLKTNITQFKLEELNQQELNQQELNQQEQEKGEELYQKGNKLQLDNKFEEAIQLLDAALLINPNHFNSLSKKVQCLFMLYKYNDAIIWADKALSINSKDVLSLSTKGNSLRCLGKYDEAIMILDQALNFNPNDFSSLSSKGECLQSLSKYSEAIVYYNKAIQINPTYQWVKDRKTECEKQLNIKK